MASKQKIRWSFNWLINALKFLSCYLWERKLFSFVLCLLLIFGTLMLAAFLPSEHSFEGNLTVGEMSFTYAGQGEKLFLYTIRGIKSLEIEGQQTLSFTGKFENQSMPELNQIKTLKVEAIINQKNDKNILLIESSKSDIELTELRLQPQTKINKLSYDIYRNKLAFSLSNTQKQTKANILQLALGEQPLRVSLEGYYQLKNEHNLPIGLGKKRQLEFNLTPNDGQFKLNLANPVSITLQTPAPINNEANQWFRGKLEVKEVQFQKLDRTGSDQNDDLGVSTILNGTVRMAEEEREIKENQFLIVEEPGIKLIRSLNIDPKKGLEVRIAGKSKLIQIGLDQKFPVSKIRASWLDEVLPRDAIISLISFSAASFIYLLSFIIDYIAKSSTKP